VYTGIDIKAWVYNDVRATLISVALCSISVGGVVARILRLIAFVSMLEYVRSIVSAIVPAS